MSHREWQQAAQRWAELVVLRWEWDEALDPADRTAWTALQAKVEDAFGHWMMNRYGSLHNLPYHQQPVMVHQIPRFLAVERTRKKLAKIALLVLDGLAFDQWLLLKKDLEACDKAWRFQESTAFAWVPTLTSVTRQSIFAGEPPLYFPGLPGNDLEGEGPLAAVLGRPGCSAGQRGTGHEPGSVNDPNLGAGPGNPRLVVLGIVWNKVDDIMHGMQMQTAGMHNQVDYGLRRAICKNCSFGFSEGELRHLPDRRPRQRHGHRHRQSKRRRPGGNEGKAGSCLRPP